MKKFNIAFFGTPVFSAEFLEKLLTDTSVKRLTEVKLVVTQPDRPVGKKHIITKSPVKVVAEKYGIKVIDQINRKDQKSEVRNQINRKNSDKSDLSDISDLSGIRLSDTPIFSDLSELDFALVFAYGNIIPKEILEAPKINFPKTGSGFLNIHWSLLPKYRGAAPLPYSLILGDRETGISIFVMDEKLDHGPLILQQSIPLTDTDKRPQLDSKLTEASYLLFSDLLKQNINQVNPIVQNHNNATFAYNMKKEDGFIPFPVLTKALKNEPLVFDELPILILKYLDRYPYFIENFKLKISNSAKIIYDYFRGLSPWPGIWTLININGNEKRLKIIDMSLQPTTYNLQPIRVQLEGKNEVDFTTFNKAYRIF